MKSKVKTLDEIKSVRLQPCEAGFHRESDVIHQRWISPVEDGFDCVFSVKDNTHRRIGFLIVQGRVHLDDVTKFVGVSCGIIQFTQKTL